MKYSKIVLKLIKIVETNKDFQRKMKEALETQPKTSFWYKKTLDDMYLFFDEWYVFLPLVNSVKKYISNFSDFYIKGNGSELVRNTPFKEWIAEFVVARGNFMDSSHSAQYVQDWLDNTNVDIDDFVVPPGGFQSFNEFFTRTLKQYKRPIASPNDDRTIVSPADCSINQMIVQLVGNEKIKSKEMSLDVKKMLGGDSHAKQFVKGSAVVSSLEATNYHRFHSPVSGRIIAKKKLEGLCFGIKGFSGFFQDQPRGYYIIKTDKFGLVGYVAIGITTISSVNIIKPKNYKVAKGEEIGHFAYGGSAIVLLFEPDAIDFSVPVHVGNAIGTFKD
ncbi:MAG: hypothetical protein GY775_05040 [Candidatus Scalindua sp.]|nr:hypothetical protein [Candidatus Scalindua sp.]